MDRLLTRHEAAELLQCSPRTLDRANAPRIRIGRLVRYSPAELAKWAETHMVRHERPTAYPQPLSA